MIEKSEIVFETFLVKVRFVGNSGISSV